MRKIINVFYVILLSIQLFANDTSFMIQPFGWEEKNGYADINFNEYIDVIDSSIITHYDKIEFRKNALEHLENNLYILNGKYILDFTYAIEHTPLLEENDYYYFHAVDIVCLFIAINDKLDKIYYEYEEASYEVSHYPSQRPPGNRSICYYPNIGDTIYSISDSVAVFKDDSRFDSLRRDYEFTEELQFEISCEIDFQKRTEYFSKFSIGERVGAARREAFELRLKQFESRDRILPILIYEKDIKNNISESTILVRNLLDDYNRHSNDRITDKVGIANDSRVRIRTEPNLESTTIDYLDEGDIVFILDSTKETMIIDNMESVWFKIETGDDLIGWTYGFFIDVVVK